MSPLRSPLRGSGLDASVNYSYCARPAAASQRTHSASTASCIIWHMQKVEPHNLLVNEAKPSVFDRTILISLFTVRFPADADPKTG